MCGLFAALSRSGSIREDYTRQLDMIAHRGPDGSGTAIVHLANGVPEADREGRAWLGHRRLSIIDPDPRANQPMAVADDRYVMVYNGEIYNYLELRRECVAAGWSFRTESDSEVLLACWALWGEDAVRRFVGMFAFVIVDREAGQAWIGRDAFGIKPLHYVLTDDRLLICSELPPLVSTGRVPLDIDPLQTVEFIRFGASTTTESTLIDGVRRLPAASVARFDFATGALSEPRIFWRPNTARRKIGFADAVAECRERFLTNIRLHLRSDVPVGAALSGGLDSSSIVCAIHHLEPDVRLNTFSFISAEPGQSEEKWVDIVNAHIGAEAHKVVPQPGDLANDIDRMIAIQGEPFGSASIYAQYRVFAMAREAGVPVTLDGQGADEILAGYWPYVATYGASQIRRGRIDRALRLIAHGGDSMGTRLRMAAQLGQALLPAGAIGRYRRALGRSILPPFLDSEWLTANRVDEAAIAGTMLTNYPDMASHLMDTTVRTSLPTLLRIADRSSMAFSVESRVPFLTPDFADFLFSLPPEYIVSPRGDRKHVFREAMHGILPEAIRTRRDKIGFFADDGLWLRGNRATFERYRDAVAAVPAFNSKRTGDYLRGFFDEGRGSAQQVWRIFMFAIWSDRMRGLAG
ncbi:MAG: asparagine synthase (glutamine-hydrolyzing) [Sphingopyxis sp.]|nr:asparagine synthase (glutamine-hydrolyzing) [Sphingopyxis sp.]